MRLPSRQACRAFGAGMLVLRSVLFNVAFYLNLIVQMIVWTPFYFLSPRHIAWFVPKFWSRSSLYRFFSCSSTTSVQSRRGRSSSSPRSSRCASSSR